MHTIHADQAISMSEFKKNPTAVLKQAKHKPVAVLNHNKPAFYMIEPELFEALLEEVADRDLYRKVAERRASKSEAVDVRLEDL